MEAWPGSVFALDFTGHGASTVPAGGGYTAETLMADADAALAELGEVTLLGWGVGAYAALLLAGSRPLRVRGTVLCDGEGFTGGGETGAPPDMSFVASGSSPPDPFALHELTRDARPAGYVRLFARQAAHLSPVSDPITVAAGERPAWVEGILTSVGVRVEGLSEALDRYGSHR